jgi:serine/threonine protein kinase
MFAFWRAPKPAPPAPPADLGSHWREVSQSLAPDIVLTKIYDEGTPWTVGEASTASGEPVLVRFTQVWENDTVRRLERELRACSQLKHPCIRNCLNFGFRDDWFWVTEPLPGAGPSLSDLLQKHPPAPEQSMQWLCQLHDTLAHAHRIGLYHGHLSPEWLHLESGRLVVSGFGYNVQMPYRAVCHDHIDLPYAIAPESINGMGAGPDSDLWALGVLGFHLLTGKHPFAGSDPMQQLLRILTTPAAALRSVAPELPEEWELLVAGWLQREPALRREARLPRGVLPPLSSSPSAALDVVLQLQAEGTWEATDEFTLDPAKAAEKLAQFQFVDTGDFLLALAAAANAWQCDRLEVTQRGNRLTLDFPGVQLRRDQLEALFARALSGRREALAHLGLGVAGALRYPGAQATLESGGWRLQLRGLQVPQCRPGRHGDLRLTLELPRSGPLLSAELQQRTALGHTRLVWNQATPAREREPLTVPLEVQGRQCRLDIVFNYVGNVRGVPVLTAVVDGLAYAVPFRLPAIGAEGVVYAPLRIDLSYRNLIRDDFYHAVLEAVPEALTRVALEEARWPVLDLERIELYRMAALEFRAAADSQVRLQELYRKLLAADTGSHGALLTQHGLYQEALQRCTDTSIVADAQARLPSLLRQLPDDWKEAVRYVEGTYDAHHPARHRLLLFGWALGQRARPPINELNHLLRQCRAFNDDEQARLDEVLPRALRPYNTTRTLADALPETMQRTRKWLLTR